MSRIDPFTRENIGQGLIAAAEEMFASWGRTSQSTIIYEVLDYAAGLTDSRANLIGQANGVTGFLGTITYGVKSVIDKFGLDNLKPDDIVLTNDPYTGSGTHLCDVSAVMPIYYQGELIAFASNKGHWNEIGGMNLGSWSTGSTEIYQEGLQFPSIKVYREGELNTAVRDMIAANCRTPEMTLGDLYAQTASLRIAERRVVELCDKYGREAVKESIDSLLNKGKQRALNELKDMPKGTFSSEGYIDTESNGIDDVYITAEITITDEKFIIDITGSDEQVPAPINCTRYGALSAARVAYHSLASPDAQPNEGFYSPIELKGPQGTVFTATRPAPISCNWEGFAHLTDLVARALAPVMPERITAGHFLSIMGTIVGGIDDDSGSPFVLCEPQAGGWGAGVDKDGENGLVAIDDGDTYNIPVEVAEHKYPIRVEQYAFNLNSGAGKYRGGYGLYRDYRILNSSADLTVIASRYRYPPWGVAGGQQGSPNYIEVYHQDEEEPVTRPTFTNYSLVEGELVRFVTGGGGGYGKPEERNPKRVLEDVRDGFITVEEAENAYGVCLDAEKMIVLKEETEKLRSNRP